MDIEKGKKKAIEKLSGLILEESNNLEGTKLEKAGQLEVYMNTIKILTDYEELRPVLEKFYRDKRNNREFGE